MSDDGPILKGSSLSNSERQFITQSYSTVYFGDIFGHRMIFRRGTIKNKNSTLLYKLFNKFL